MTSPPPTSPAGGAMPDLIDDEPRPAATREPNYFARRVIAVGVVVAVLAGGSVIAGRIIGGGGDGDGGTPVSAEWDSIVLVSDDEVRVVDPDDGETTATYPAEEPLLDADTIVTGHTLVTINEFGRITELDLRDGAIRRTSAVEGSSLVLSGDNPGVILAGPAAGGDVTVVDVTDRVTLDIGDVAGLIDPLMFVDDVFVDASGRHVATADARSFQSVLVDIDERTSFPLAGQVVALDDDTVVTALRAGDRAELEFFDLQGERRGSADGPAPRAIMLTSPTTALVVSSTGAVSVVEANGDVEQVAVVAPPAGSDAVEVIGGEPAHGAERLLLQTDQGVVLLDDAGTEVARTGGELLTPLTRTSTCAIVGEPRRSGTAVHLDLETGEVLGEFSGGIVASTSADGCTTSMVGDQPRVVVRGVERRIETPVTGDVVVTPDGGAYVATTTGQRRLIELPDDAADDAGESGGGEATEPVVLATDPVRVHFAKL